MKIEFLLNGEPVCLDITSPTQTPNATTTVLDWLRNERGLTGTKEGCNEGDCGACTVMVANAADGKTSYDALNACILFLPQIHGKALFTVEGLSHRGQPHPVQSAMVEHHGSQCGFCTPGFVMSMAAAHQSGRTDHDDVLAGNLCRCTGYAPIVRAATAAQSAPKSKHFNLPKKLITTHKTQGSDTTFMPTNSDDLADWYLQNPTATLIGGATDVGLWVNKNHADITPMAFLSGVADLCQIEEGDHGFAVGAAVTIAQLQIAIAKRYPSLAELLRRYGSTQVRNAATIGGNIANGSPIGDAPPALIALNARLHLRCGDDHRDIALEDYFLDYGKQDRGTGEFVVGITLPNHPDALRCYKISKRFDQDISALLGCFNILVENGTVSGARIAFGGMAAIPKRAKAVENALIGQPWNEATITAAEEKFTSDFKPISDARASANYRQHTARNLLLRYFHDTQMTATNVLEVRP